jgi:PAS domain S-box-containing protein
MVGDVGVIVGILRGAVAVGVAIVAGQTAIAWWRRRGTGQGYLAASIGLIAAATGLRGLGDVVGGSVGRVLVEGALVSFAGSGVALLSFRHSLVPVDPRRHVVITAATAAVAAGAVTARAAVSPESAIALAGGGAVVLVWLASVAEPVITFWRLSAARSPIQRARLRALATGYALVAVVAAASVVTERVESDAALVALHSLSLAVLPVMYAGLAAPAWLRRWWRQPVERAARLALLDVVGGDDADAVAGAAVRWARQLVGGTAAAVVDASGDVLASTGGHEDELRRLAAVCGPHAELARDGAGRDGHAVVAPLGRDASRGALVVLADPLAPLLRSDEVGRLGDLALALTAVFDRFDTLGTLARQTDRYEKLLQAIADMGVAFLIVDRHTDRVVFANDAMTRLTGYTRDELFDLPTFAELLPPEEVGELVRRVDQGVIGEVLSEAHETVAVRRDGSRVMIEVSAKVTDDGAHVVALVRDVSERRRAAAHDRRRLLQLSALASAAGDLARESTETARLLPALAEAARSVLGSRWASVRIVDGTGAPPLTATAGERASWGEELGIPLVRGDETVGVLYLGPKEGPDGGDTPGFDEIDAAAGTAFASLAAEAVAVSRAFAREAELVDQLQALDRMKDTFLNAVSHELRTPLAVILGMSETVADRHDELEPADLHRLLQGVMRNAEKLDRLLNDLLDIDRLNRGILQPHRRLTDLTLLVESVLADIGLRDRHPVSVDVEPVIAALDAPKVERVLENLLRNADLHTPDGTPIWLRLARVPEGVLLSVDDAGPGVPENLRGSVFEPFERGADAEASPTGVGIGLSLVARFAELHGGRAWVTERPGGGASFRVLLASDEVTAAPGERAPSAPAVER